MFEHFTFGAQAQKHLLQVDDVSTSCSPTDCSFPLQSAPTSYFPPSPPGPKGMSDIVDAFSQQTLYPDEIPTQSRWNHRLPSPESDFSNPMSVDENEDEDEEEALGQMIYMSTARGMATVRPRVDSGTVPARSTSGTVACRRLQRQLNVQLQSSNSHIRDINTLVSDMINNNSQCRLHTSKSNTQLASPPPSGLIPSSTADLTVDPLYDAFDRQLDVDVDVHEDEGFAELDDGEYASFGLMDEEISLSLRTASVPSGIRKYNVVRWRKSVESMIGNGNVATAPIRPKVRNVPRMRRRKVESVSK